MNGSSVVRTVLSWGGTVNTKMERYQSVPFWVSIVSAIKPNYSASVWLDASNDEQVYTYAVLGLFTLTKLPLCANTDLRISMN